MRVAVLTTIRRKQGSVSYLSQQSGAGVEREQYEGRLELTWTNKDRALLAHEDSSYEWLPPSDYRVAEVRLLREAGKVGKVHSDSARAKDNLLIRGDALHALTTLLGIPEYSRQYAGKVKLVYLDPPFNTQQAFEHYDDALEHSVWLTMMRDRLEQVKELLADEGSVWVHCDDSEQHRLRCLMDEVFGRDNFRTVIVWQKVATRKSNAEFSTSHDYLLVYARDREKFSRNLQPPTEEQLARYKNPDNDPRGPWISLPFHVRTDNPARRSEYRYTIALPSGRKVGPPRGRHWNGKRARYEELLADNRFWFGKKGDSLPRFKDFAAPDTMGTCANVLVARHGSWHER
jgi:adenine-specific DNA-methyltransferase